MVISPERFRVRFQLLSNILLRAYRTKMALCQLGTYRKHSGKLKALAMLHGSKIVLNKHSTEELGVSSNG